MNPRKAKNVAKTYIKSLVYPYIGMGTVPIWVHLWVTRRCNLACKYCYVYQNDYPELDTAGMMRAIDHAKDVLGCTFVALMGGEPTIRKDVPAIVAHMTARDVFSFMSTNGFLLSDRKIYELCEAGIDVIELSLDGMNETPVSRKAGSKLVDTLERLVGFQDVYNTELSVNMVITKQNYTEFDDIVRLVAGKRISLTTGLYMPDPLARGDVRDDPLAFTSPEDLIALQGLVDKILRLKKRGAFIAHDKGYYEKWVPFMRQLAASGNHANHATMWTCRPGRDFLEVDCDGRIRYCSYLTPLADRSLTIFDLDRHYYKRLKAKMERMAAACNARCLANCFYEVTDIKHHPFRFATTTMVKQVGPQLRNTPDVMAAKEPLRQALVDRFGSFMP